MDTRVRVASKIELLMRESRFLEALMELSWQGWGAQEDSTTIFDYGSAVEIGGWLSNIKALLYSSRDYRVCLEHDHSIWIVDCSLLKLAATLGYEG